MTRTGRFLSLSILTGAVLTACSASDEPSVAASPSNEPVETVAQVDPETVSDPTDLAGDNDSVEVRQADSHVHGGATLALALDGDTLSVEFETPLYNLIGFEHAPRTDEQTQAVTRAEAALAEPGSLFVFNPEAACTADAVSPVHLFDDHDHGHDDDDHHDEDHDGDHDHADEHDHHHEEDQAGDHDHADDSSGEAAKGRDHDDHDHSSEHKDALLEYSFTCENPDALSWMANLLFDRFENLSDVEVVYLGPSAQISADLTRDIQRLSLSE